jgi:3-oxoadipate enol-lactonase
MPFVEISHPNEPSFNMFWKVTGQGPPLMLVRGLARSHRYFAPIIPFLQQHFTVILFDNRGAGKSDHPKGPYSSQQMASDCVQVLAATGFESAWFLGMSLGGMIVLDIANQYPDKVLGMVLGSCTPRGKGSVPVSVWPQVLLAVSALLPKKLGRKLQAYVTLSDDFIGQADEIMDVWDEYAKDEPFKLASLLAQNAAISSHDSMPYLHKITAPTLLLAGKQDRLVDCRNTPFMASVMANAQGYIWDDTGHNMETEQPQRMAEKIIDFVQMHRTTTDEQMSL